MVDLANDNNEIIRRRLTQAGYKLTPQREDTLEVLLGNNSDLMTAEEIFIIAKEKNPSIGLATVYRTLDILFELEIVKKVPFRDGMSRYDLVQPNTDVQPYYLLCLNCGNITEINEPLIEDVKKVVEQRHHFKITTHHLTFHGICKDCLEREANESE